MFRLAAPFIFVLIWSTGFVVARAAAPHADLNLFLLVRLSITAVVMGLAAWSAGVAWPTAPQAARHAVAGGLMQGVYLGASYWAIAHGLPAGVMSLLGALQPLLTAVVTTLVFRVALGRRAWLGLAIGVCGVALVLGPKLGFAPGQLTWAPVAFGLLSVVSITAGTLLQSSSLAHADLRSASAVQNVGGVVVMAVMTLALKSQRWDGSPALWAALTWSIAGPSIIGITLLVWMVRQGEVNKATATMLLAPPLAALEAFLLFGERLSLLQQLGFALALIGVLLTRLANPRERPSRPPRPDLSLTWGRERRRAVNKR